MKKSILIPLPAQDFDPTEVAVTWKILNSHGFHIQFATPDGQIARADSRMLDGHGLGPWSFLLMADKNAQLAHLELSQSPAFQKPISWEEIHSQNYNALVLPGGHAPGMKPYLESQKLQNITADFFEENKLVAAICHGTVLACRSRNKQGQSVLFGYKTTALLRNQELTAWALTCLWLKNYYRTYPETVQSEVTRQLAKPEDFLEGPTPIFRDSSLNLKLGFVVRDRNYISARWPGDVHNFANSIVEALNN